MNRSIAARAMSVVLLVSCIMALAAPAFAGPFPDKNLEAAVRALIFEKRDDPSKELTDEDLRKVFVLEAKGKDIKDLSGLEKCINLQLLDIAKNAVTSLEPIKGLTNIQSLTISGNQVSDLTPLAGFKALQYLEASNNQIESLAPLAALEKVNALYISGNKIADLAPLAKMNKLASLDVAKNQVVDLKPLESITTLSLLKLSENKIVDTTPITKQTRLGMLLLERNQVADLGPLVTWAKTDAEGKKEFAPFLRLYLAGNPLSDAAKKDQVAALSAVGVRVAMEDPPATPAK